MSKEMNNDNDLNLHSMTKLTGWLRYLSQNHQERCKVNHIIPKGQDMFIPNHGRDH